MKCPYCSHADSKVVDSRPSDDGNSTRRRRECLSCHKRFTTYETIERAPLMVIKKGGGHQPFDRGKLMSSMLKACKKRSISVSTLEQIATDIELSLQNRLVREISTTEIGEMAMAQLRNVDEVAFVRFASVYRQFKDIHTFRDELDRLLEREASAEPPEP